MNTKNPTRARSALCFFTLIFTFALAGCGGGGGGSSGTSSVGGGGGGNSADGLRTTLRTAVESSSAGTRDVAARFATATPRAGSVTQTSNINAGTGVTVDLISAEASYDSGGQLSVTVTHVGADTTTTINTDDVVLDSNNDVTGSNTRDTYRFRRLAKRVTGGTAYADVYTDRLSATDTDYLVGGVWVFWPDSGSLRAFEIGAFADGPDANLTPATYLRTSSTATYEGDATGLWMEIDDGEADGGEFDANIHLTATFRSTNPIISGTVDTIRSRSIDDDEWESISGSLTLGEASIGNVAGGFFTGDTSATSVDDGVTYTYSGKWGGQFYGSQANSIGGTFGGNTSNNVGDTDYQETFVGAFRAEKQ